MQLFVCMIIVLFFFTIIKPFPKQKIGTVFCNAVKCNFSNMDIAIVSKLQEQINKLFQCKKCLSRLLFDDVITKQNLTP